MPSRDPAVTIESLLEHRPWVRALARRLVADESVTADQPGRDFVGEATVRPGESGVRVFLGAR